jgi:hypothetical protein
MGDLSMKETILKNESGIECRVIFNKNNKVALIITDDSEYSGFYEFDDKDDINSLIKMLHQIKYLGNEHKKEVK